MAAFRLIFFSLLCHSGNFACSRDTDGGEGLAMAGWKGEQDTVENQVSTFNTFTLIVTNISGRFRQLRASTPLCMGTRRTQWRTPPPPTSLTYRQVASLPATTRFRRIIWFGFDHLCILTYMQRLGFGGDQQSYERPPTSRAGLSNVSRLYVH